MTRTRWTARTPPHQEGLAETGCRGAVASRRWKGGESLVINDPTAARPRLAGGAPLSFRHQGELLVMGSAEPIGRQFKHLAQLPLQGRQVEPPLGPMAGIELAQQPKPVLPELLQQFSGAGLLLRFR